MRLLLPAVLMAAAAMLPAAWAQTATGDDVAILYTESGRLVIEFFPADAPQHVQNFLDLSKIGFYDGTVFHRVIEGFMIQGGDPLTRDGETTIQRWGTGGPDWTVDAEFNDIEHDRGIVSMARSSDPDSAGSQFFIVHEDSNFLDGAYTVFGRLATADSFETLDAIAGMDTPQSLQAGSSTVPVDWRSATIERVEVVSRADIPEIAQGQDPERMERVPEGTINDSTYSNPDLGISFAVPEGWSPQDTSGAGPSDPNLVIVGPTGAESLPVTIYLVTEAADGATLDEFSEGKKAILQQLVDAGQLEILSEEVRTVGGTTAYARTMINYFTGDTGFVVPVVFKDTDFMNAGTIYSITYAADERTFDQYVDRYDHLLDTVSFDAPGSVPGDAPAEAPGSGAQDDGGGCLIATAAFGTELAPQVQHLRELRDHTILQTDSGSAFMSAFNGVYYSFSPAVADLEREHPAFRELVRAAITPMISSLHLLDRADSEAEVVGYGLGIILLNAALYLGTPALLALFWTRSRRAPLPR